MNETTMKHGKEYCCKRWRMYTWLRERGFYPVKTIPDCKRADFNNWIFENSPELENAIYEYFDGLTKK